MWKCQIPVHQEWLQGVLPGCVRPALLTAVSEGPALGKTGQKMGSGRCNPTDLGGWWNFYCVPLFSGSLENNPDNGECCLGCGFRLEG